MRIKSLPQFFNTVITLVLSFIAVWTVLLSLKLARPLAIIFAILFSCLISATVFILSAKPSKASLQNIKRGKLYALMDKFNMCTADEIFNIFLPIFNELNISASLTDDHITLASGQKIYLAFFPSAITDNELMTIYRKCRYENLIVFSNSFTSPCYALAKKLKIKLFSAQEIFELLESFNALPVQTENKTPPFYDGILSRLFERKNGTRFIILGLTLIIIAFAVFYPLYYYVMGAIFVTYGFICLIFAKSKVYSPETLKDTLIHK